MIWSIVALQWHDFPNMICCKTLGSAWEIIVINKRDLFRSEADMSKTLGKISEKYNDIS